MSQFFGAAAPQSTAGRPAGSAISRTIDQVARVDQAGEDGLLQGHAGGAGTERARRWRGCSIRSVDPISVAGSAGSVRTLIRTVSARSPSMMSSAPRPSMVSLPRAAEQDVALAPDVPGPAGRAPTAAAVPSGRRTDAGCSGAGSGGGSMVAEPVDAGDAGLVEHVAAGEAGAADVAGDVVVAPDDVVERGRRSRPRSPASGRG